MYFYFPSRHLRSFHPNEDRELNSPWSIYATPLTVCLTYSLMLPYMAPSHTQSPGQWKNRGGQRHAATSAWSTSFSHHGNSCRALGPILPPLPLVSHTGMAVQTTCWMEALDVGVSSATVPKPMHHMAHLVHMEACVFRDRVQNLGHLSLLSTPLSSIFHLQRSSSFHAKTVPEVSYFIKFDLMSSEKACSFQLAIAGVGTLSLSQLSQC